MFAPKIARSAVHATATAEPSGQARAGGRAALRPTERTADFSAVPVFAVSRVDDPLERAADGVADQVMRMPDAAASPGEPAAQHECGRPREPARAGAHDAAQSGATELDATAAEDAYRVISGPGQALEASARDFFEPRFGHDFSRVRVHAGPRAAASARALRAHAYTVGADIVFGPGRYQPGSEPGRRLLAHELAHVRQQAMAPRTVRAGVVQRQPDAGKAAPAPVPAPAPAPDWRTGTEAFNLILQHEFPVVSSSWFAGTSVTLPAGGGVRADLKTGRNGQVLFDLSPDFAPAGQDAAAAAADPGRIAAVRAEVIRVLQWRLGQGILTAQDVKASFVTDHLRAMAPLALRALRAKPTVQPDAQAELDRILAITTQIPPGAQFSAQGAAELTVNGVHVRILPDTTGGDENRTRPRFVPDHLDTPGFREAGGKVTKITDPIPVAPVVEIFTSYAAHGPDAGRDPLTTKSAYGRGTTAADRAAGTTSLRFHESQHGQDVLDFIASHPFPVFAGKVGQTTGAFRRARTDFQAQFESWAKEMGRVTICATDCVGSPDIDTFEQNTGPHMKCTTCHP